MKVVATILLSVSSLVAFGQNIYMDKEGKVSFYSNASLENIEAHNSQALGIIELDKGRVGITVLIKGFKFEKALMEEHFNENYMESDKYPKAVFVGKILGYEDLDFFNPSGVEAVVEGEITIHGVKKFLHSKVFFIAEGKILKCTAEFKLKPEHFKIKIPALVVNNIAKEIVVKANFSIAKKN
jgi:hypothetical protein